MTAWKLRSRETASICVYKAIVFLFLDFPWLLLSYFIESFESSTLWLVSQVLLNEKASVPKLTILHFQPQLKGFAVYLWKWLNHQMGEKCTTKLIMPHLQALSFHLLNRCSINNSRLHFLTDEFAFHEIIKLKKKSAKLTAPQPLSLAWPWLVSCLTPLLSDFPPGARKGSQKKLWALTATWILWGYLPPCLCSPDYFHCLLILLLSFLQVICQVLVDQWVSISIILLFKQRSRHRHKESQSASMATYFCLHFHYPLFSSPSL